MNDVRHNGRVALVLSPPLTHSFELTLARALDLVKAGEQPLLLYCNGAVKGCVSNPLNLEIVCKDCRRVRDKAIGEQLADCQSAPLDSFYRQSGNAMSNDIPADDGKALEDGVNSTIKTFYRVNWDDPPRPKFLTTRLFAKLNRSFGAHSRFVYRAIDALLDAKLVDRIEFFNGRIVPTRALLVAARRHNVSYNVIEVSGLGNPMFLTADEEVHDLQYQKARLRDYIDNVFEVDKPNFQRRQQLGVRFFEERRRGRSTNDPSFTQGQVSGLLQLPPGKKVIGIFLSSADELEISGEQWATPASRAPEKFILELRDALPQDFYLVVRMHPNQRGDRTGSVERILDDLSDVPGLRLIKPNDPESTYEIIDHSDFVLTFGSTVGLEAPYWGKISLIAGRALWEDAGVQLNVQSVEDIARIVMSGGPKPNGELAIAVGAYLMDQKDTSDSLGWNLNGKFGFFVDGRRYLDDKRLGAGYWVSRAFDHFLRGLTN